MSVVPSSRRSDIHVRRPSIIASLVCLAGALAAQPAVGDTRESTTLTFSADRSFSVFAEGRERMLLSGSARVQSDAFRISAREIEIYGDRQRYVRAAGSVVVHDDDNDLYLTCDDFFLDRDDDFLRASGNAYMEDRSNEVVVKGAVIQNWSELDLTEISVNVRILGSDYTARAQFARYRRQAETLELSGAPEVYWKGDEYRAERISIDLGRDEIEFVGDVRAVVQRREGGAGE